MPQHVHYDRDAALRMFDVAQAAVNRAIDSGPKPASQKAMEKGLAPIHRELIGFIVDCRNAGYEHEEVAFMIGGLLAHISFTIIENYTWPCVQGRIREAFAANLTAMLSRDPDVLVAGAEATLYPMQGGSA